MKDGFISVACGTPKLRLADCHYNAEQTFTMMRSADKAGVKVLVLTTFDDKETVDKAVSSGADGYILKEMDNEKIINSIKAVAGGINVFSDNVFKSIKKDVVVQQSAKNYDLTEREIDFLRLICDGCDNKEIAAKLYLAEGTVRNGISRLLEKLKLKDRTQLAVFAIKNNII